MKSPMGIMLLLLIWPADLSSVFATEGSKSARPPNLSPGTQFRDCDSCPEMIVVPAGTFTIGSPPNEPGRRANEGPQVNIRIGQPFAVGRYEVTRQQYEDFLRSTNRSVSGNCMTDRRKPGTWGLDAETNFHDPGFLQTGDHPAACVSWNDAKAYRLAQRQDR